MTAAQFQDLQDLARRLAERAQAVASLLRQGDFSALDEDTVDLLLLTLGAGLEDVAAVEARLRGVLQERG